MFLEIFTAVCMLLGGIGVFLLGIKFMSNGLDKGAGKSVKKVFVKIGDNRFANAGIGMGATAVIQSSTAVTVMTVGFANTGILTLVQAVAVIMGANVGTTFTAFLGIFGDLPVTPFFIMSGLLGVALFMFSKRPKLKLAGEIITGLALIFVGLFLINQGFRRSDIVMDAFRNVFEVLAATPVGPLLLTLVGAVFTAIIQSSTAATTIAVSMAAAGVLPLGAAIFIILGANIGTAVTAIIAGFGASTNAKRAGMAHLLYNIVGIIIFLPILWPLQNQTAWLLTAMATPMTAVLGMEPYALAAALFHLIYNIILFLILIWLVRPFAKLVSIMVREKPGEMASALRLHFIDDKTMLATVPASSDTFAAAKSAVLEETVNMAKLAHENLAAAFRGTIDFSKIDKVRMVNTEQKINFINKGIGQFIVKMGKVEGYMPEGEKRLNNLHHVISEIERMGDRAMDILEISADMKDQNIILSETAVNDLEHMFETLSEMFAHCLEVFETRNAQGLEEVLSFRKEVGEIKRNLGFGHISRLNKGECTVEAGVHFYAIITGLESIRNHLVNLAFSIRSTAGIQHEQLKQLSRERVKRRTAAKKIYW